MKTIHVSNNGYMTSRETYAPNCSLSKLIIEFLSKYKKNNFVFSDLLVFKNHGYEIHYTGKKSKDLHLVGAIYDEPKK